MTTDQPPGEPDEAIPDVDVDELDDVELRRHVAKLSATVRALSTSVARLSGAVPASVARSAVDGEDAAEDVAAGEDLVAWVQWLIAHYELDNIPDCWTQHGALVEELDSLRVGWLDTIGSGQGGLAGVQWHDYFGRTLERFDRRWRARNCEDTHRDTILPAWVTKDPATLEPPDLEAARYRPSG